MEKFPSILVILTIGISGCCANPIASTIDLPPRPELLPMTQQQWESIPPDVGDIVDYNTLELKTYAKRLESRIRIHNETVTN